MSFSLNQVKALINPNINKLSSIVVTTSNTKIGDKAAIQIPSNCLFIYANGYYMPNNITGGKLVIMLQGGKPGWADEKKLTNIFPEYPRAQLDALNAVVDYITSLNSSVNFELESKNSPVFV